MTTVARRTGRVGDMLSWLDESGLLTRSGMGLMREVRIEDFVEDGTYTLRAEIPGVDPDKDLDVQIDGDMLVVRGERKEESHEKGRSELHYGSFERAVRLPKGAHVDEVTATYTDGVLELKLPFDVDDAEAATRRIPIQHAEK